MQAPPGQHGERSEGLISCFTLKISCLFAGFPYEFSGTFELLCTI